PLKILRYSWKQTSSVLLFSWTHAANTVSRDIIRFPQMRYTEIFRLIVLICSLQKKHRSTQAALTAPPKLLQTCLYLLTTVLTDCRFLSAAAPITTVHTISRKS